MSLFYTINGSVCTTQNVACIFIDPLNPLDLPPNTVRVRTNDGNVPRKSTGSITAVYETATLVPGTSDTYDVYKSGTSFRQLLYASSNVVEVLGANTTGISIMTSMFGFCHSLTSVQLFDTSSVTDMSWLFSSCELLPTVPLFDTSRVTDMYAMFGTCHSLTSVPLFDTSRVTDMSYMFYGCSRVETGALALYQQVSAQLSVPLHLQTFYICGSNTTTGAAELSQIPADWK